MDGLEAVAHVGQGARDDDAHRVVEVRDAHLVLDADGSDVAHVVGHVVALLGSGSAAVDDRALGGRGSGQRGEVGGRRGGARRWTGRRAGGGCRRGVARSSSASGGGELGERVADDPGAMAVVGRRAGARPRRGDAAVVARRSTLGERAAAPTTSAFWTSGSASPMRCPRSGEARGATISGSRRVAAVDVGQGRDGRADEAALPARRRVDELLELRPAVGLGEDPVAGRGRGGRRDRRPPRGAARADELPGQLGLVASVRSSRPKPIQRSSGWWSRSRRSATNRSGPSGSCRVAALNPRETAVSNGRRTP